MCHSPEKKPISCQLCDKFTGLACEPLTITPPTARSPAYERTNLRRAPRAAVTRRACIMWLIQARRSSMPWDNVLAVALFSGLIGLAILIVLWPGEKHGKRLLERWGVPDPDPAEVALAVRYLKRRRLWYPWLFLALPPLFGD